MHIHLEHSWLPLHSDDITVIGVTLHQSCGSSECEGCEGESVQYFSLDIIDDEGEHLSITMDVPLVGKVAAALVRAITATHPDVWANALDDADREIHEISNTKPHPVMRIPPGFMQAMAAGEPLTPLSSETMVPLTRPVWAMFKAGSTKKHLLVAGNGGFCKTACGLDRLTSDVVAPHDSAAPCLKCQSRA